ncbi:MAG: bifunctional glutamate N-acetyltransferase/amino-acid acetyltransferase ArgJ [Acidimicrobiales bacterium]
MAPEPTLPPLTPAGFSTHVANVGIRDDTADFLVIASDRPAAAAGVFTQSRFAGPSVLLSRAHLAASPTARAIVSISKNANVANGAQGDADAREVAAGVAAAVGAAAEEVLIGSTGVIGRPYPMDKVRAHLAALGAPPYPESDFAAAARAIMTTDTVPKWASARVGSAVVTGIAKGVGMIEPNMATLLTYFCTDASLDPAALEVIFRRVIDATFNCVSVDTDTSTSDTALILANGAAGPVEPAAFEAALGEVALALTKMVARDGEGATKLIEVRVDHAADARQAKRVAKSIVNSPLVKTAVHGADPNWGRVAMAVGKCHEETDIDQRRVVIRFGSLPVYPAPPGGADLAQLSTIMKAAEVLIHVSLGTGDAAATVWGCDLSDGYVRINADYTT